MLDIDKLMKELTLEEKAGLCSGLDNWRTKGVERLGLRPVMVADGPSGVRVEDGEGGSKEAVCFPTGSALSSTFNKALTYELGLALGAEARSFGLHTLLGPAINIKRTPLGGRNFEYLSEDPYLCGALSSSYVKGVEKNNVGVSPKHFACNNQEYMRMSTNVHISERALREIYLPAFEMTEKEAHPWTIMCSYNRINGLYSSKNKRLLSDILRDEWGFDGIVMTDWGAVCDRVESLKAGTELEMPSSRGVRDREIVEAVKNGTLDEETLDRAVRRLLEWIDKAYDNTLSSYDKEKDHLLAKTIAEEGAVLLKNDDGLLPLNKNEKVVVIGTSASSPRYQGGGSSRVNPYRVSSPLEELGKRMDVEYYPGWKENGVSADTVLEEEALNAIKGKRAVIFASLPDSFESEGFDRHSMKLPEAQLDLISRALEINGDTIVVLFNGSSIEMPFADKAKAILEMNLPGEGVGEAVAEILTGEAEPSGRLSETYPVRLEDNPSYLFYPGDGRDTLYGEDIYVGYRYYDKKKMDVLFPFGHGLGYTSFSMGNMRVEKKGDFVDVRVTLKNEGKRKGKSVVQIYVNASRIKGKDRAVRELKAFEKVELEPGEEKELSFILTKRSFSYWEEKISSWYVEKGEYVIEAGFSSRNIVQSESIMLDGDDYPLIVDEATTVGEVIKAGKLEKLGEDGRTLIRNLDGTDVNVVLKGEAAEGMVTGCPLHCIYSYGDFEEGTLDRIESALKSGE